MCCYWKGESQNSLPIPGQSEWILTVNIWMVITVLIGYQPVLSVSANLCLTRDDLQGSPLCFLVSINAVSPETIRKGCPLQMVV